MRRHLLGAVVEVAGERAFDAAAGTVQLSRGRRSERSSITALGPDQAAPIIVDYLRVATAPRPYFDAGPDSPVEAFRAEADRHPVFRLASLPR